MDQPGPDEAAHPAGARRHEDVHGEQKVRGQLSARLERAHCRRCGFALSSDDVSNARCHRCRLEFDPTNPTTYLEQRRFPHWSLWVPGMGWGMVLGVAAYASFRDSGVLGPSAFFVLPWCVGAIVGYLSGLGRWTLVSLALITGLATVWTAYGVGAVGMICASWLLLVALVPLLIGTACGALLRALVLRSLPVPPRRVLAALLLLPWVTAGIETAINPPPPTVVVQTASSFDADPLQTWEGVVFYEDVEHEPPLLLRWAMPVPVGVEGASDRVGAEPRCVYESGYLVKRITVRDPGRELAFEVIEQKIGMEHDVMLRDGRFLLSARPDGRTDVVLETRYDAPLRPRWFWRPAERMVVRELHLHVLRGMREKAERRAPVLDRPSPPAAPDAPSAPAAMWRPLVTARDARRASVRPVPTSERSPQGG